jgi:hypothetical protein
MSDDRSLKSWVSDQLHGLLGFAEGNLASYVVGLGASRTRTRFPSISADRSCVVPPFAVASSRGKRPASPTAPDLTTVLAPRLPPAHRQESFQRVRADPTAGVAGSA